MIKLSELKTNPDNPRHVNDEKFKKLCQSIKDFGEKMMPLRPIIIDENNIILGGNMRFKALKKLGYKEIPNDWIKRADELSEEDKKEFIIKDNVGFGDWDFETLTSEWDVDQLDKWGLEIPDFEIEEIEKEAEEDDYEMPEELKTDIVLGDLFEIGEHRLLCGDSTNSDDVEKLMNGKKADMVFTDPPYGVSYEGGHNKKKRKGINNDTLQDNDLSNLFRDSINTACLFSHDYCPFYIWYASGKSMETFIGLSKTDISVRAIICWYKIKSGLGAFMAQYIPNYEPCIYGHKKGKSIKWYGETDEKTVWELPNDNKNKLHPTQKPIPLAERAIKNSSKTQSIVYDCFLGGGTTMVAAHQLNRKCYGMELDPKYCQVIVDRMMKLDPDLVVKRNGEIYKPQEMAL